MFLVLKIQYHFVKNTLLQTAFSPISPTGQRARCALKTNRKKRFDNVGHVSLIFLRQAA